jgi:hypothetical protein
MAAPGGTRQRRPQDISKAGAWGVECFARTGMSTGKR